MNRLITLLVTAFLFAPLAGSLTPLHAEDGNDWPAWGGPNGNFSVKPGLLEPEQPFELKVGWKRDLGSGYSAVSVQGKMAVTMFSDSTFDYVIALNVKDGTEFWRFKIDTTFPGRWGSANGSISTPLIADDKVVGLSAAGRLFVLEQETGKLLWDTDLVTQHQAKIPFYGFATSPLLYNNALIIETGGTSNNAISAFDPNTGQVLWATSSDTVEYQSPFLLHSGDANQLVGITNRALYGLRPESGEVLWQFEHGGTTHPMGAASGNLMPVGNNQFFLKNTNQGGILLKLQYANQMHQVEEVWKTKAIKGTYVVPVYHDGYLYGYNSRILNCIDVETGERVWRSRAPGDGFPIVVDGHLVVATKDGRLSVAPTSSAGYNEVASLDLFDNLVWTPASFAGGRLYLRSMTEIAAVDIIPAQTVAATAGKTEGIVPMSGFAQFIKKVEQSGDKSALVDEFMAAQKEFPVIEGDDVVHFVYRGDANDMALMGDLVGWRYDRPMHHVAGTDLFYYSARLESDTRLTYKFLKDLQTPVVDSLNSRTSGTIFFGSASWFSMPKWSAPNYLDSATVVQSGRIDSLQLKSAITDSTRAVEVYLPAGYDANDGTAYPIAYVHGGSGATGLGKMTTALDNLIGKRIQPFIVVYMPTFYGGGYREYIGSKRDTYLQVFVKEIIPLVEQAYRILPGPENRANIGHLTNAAMAFYSTFKHRELFGKLGVQSMWSDEKETKKYNELISPVAQDELQIYFEWGKYDFRSPLESMDLIESSPKVASLLKAHGFDLTGGEVHDGTGWASWKNRIDRVFETFFPLPESRSEQIRVGGSKSRESTGR